MHRAYPCKIALFVLLAFTPPAFLLASERPNFLNERLAAWRFVKGEQEGAESPAFDASTWSEVHVPHDWAIAGPFDPAADGATGKLPWRGVGWYRCSYPLNCRAGTRVYLDFDGVMAFPKVYVNGKLAGQWDYGYTSFRVDATPFVNFEGTNVIAVRVDTTKHTSRWYPGAGIYRKVMLQVREPVHIAEWATYITTPEISDRQATVAIRTTVENHTNEEAIVGINFKLRDPDGKPVGAIHNGLTIPASQSKGIEQLIRIDNPQRWDINSPRLYTLETEVIRNLGTVDRETTTFGIRDFKFTADDGFHLNGRRVQLHGVCLHHDQGPLGAAFNARAMERQLQIMRDMGANAIRTSHNPPAPELLELCDRLGFVVWDECFDKWDGTADRVRGLPSLQEHGERHLRSMVMRDRNHPSVVTWSIGNELKEGGEGLTPEHVQMMRDIVRKYDATRLVGIACHIPALADAKILDALDLTGWNYARRYSRFRERYPTKPIIYSESASALSTRGFYELPLPSEKTDYSEQKQVDSYDFNAARWSDIPDAEFKLMHDDPFVAGEFVWTGFDYLGEPTPFAKDAASSYFGIVDTCGIPKDRYYLYRSYWRPDVLTVHILPHWNWPNRIGKPVPVFVYTNGDSAELFLNGKSLGKRFKGKAADRPANESSYYEPTYAYRLRWNDVMYEPGELNAVAYKDGKPIGTAFMRTAEKPSTLRLTPDRTELSDSGDDLTYVLVEALNAAGNPCPLADALVSFKLTGPAEIAGVSNGDPLSLEPYHADHRKLFFGKAMLIVRPTTGGSGKLRITAMSDGLQPASVTCIVRPSK
jgi:beta-galactosidase